MRGRVRVGALVGEGIAAPLHVLQQRHQRRRRDTGDAGGGAQGRGASQCELAADLARQAADRAVVEVRREQQRLVAPERGDVPFLAFEVTRIAGVDLELLGDFRRQRAELGPNRGQTRQVDPGIGQQLRSIAGNTVLVDDDPMALQRRGRHAQFGEPAAGLIERRYFRGKAPLALSADRAQTDADRRQALVGVVRPQGQPVFGARGEHPVRLAGAAGDEVIDQHPDISVGAVEHQRLRSARRERRVEAGDEALRRRLLIAGRAVDLPREIEPGKPPRLQARTKLARVDEIVLDGIAGPPHRRAFEPRDRPQHRFLRLPRQRGRDAVRVDRVVVEPLGLEKDLVPLALGKAHDLVLDRRTIARADAGDLARIHRRAVEIGANDGMRRRGRHCDVADDLRRLDAVGHEREGRRRVVAGLHIEPGPVYRAAVEPRRRAGLEAPERKAVAGECLRQPERRLLADTARRDLLVADMDQAVEKGAGRQDDPPRRNAPAVAQHEPADMPAAVEQ